MFVVVDRKLFLRRLDLARDDKKLARTAKADDIPYLRICATEDGKLRLSGIEVDATFTATVHEPGVLFIRARRFRDLVRSLTGDPMLAIQVSAKGLSIANVHYPMDKADIKFYAEPVTAPEFHPGDTLRAREATQAEIKAAKKRVEKARDKVLLAAEAMVQAESELADMLHRKIDVRVALARLLEQITPKSARTKK